MRWPRVSRLPENEETSDRGGAVQASAAPPVLSRRLLLILAVAAGNTRKIAKAAKARRILSVATVASITDTDVTFGVRLSEPKQVEVCLREVLPTGGTGSEICQSSPDVAKRHQVTVSGLEGYSTYRSTVRTVSTSASSSGPGPQRAQRFVGRSTVQSAPGGVAGAASARPAADPLAFTEEPSVIVNGRRVGIRWSTNNFSNGWIDYTPLDRKGDANPFNLRQKFEIPEYGEMAVKSGLTKDHRICLDQTRQNERFSFTANSAQGQQSIQSSARKFSTGTAAPTYGGGFASIARWRLSTPLVRVRALTDHRLLLIGSDGSLDVRQLIGDQLTPMGSWQLAGTVADAALAPTARLVVLSSTPGLDPGSPSSQLDIYDPAKGAPGGFTLVATISGLAGFPVTVAVESSGVLVAFTGRVREDGIPESTMHPFLPEPTAPGGYDVSAGEIPYGQVADASAGAGGTLFFLSAGMAVLALGPSIPSPYAIWTGENLGGGIWTTAAGIASDANGRLVVADDCARTIQLLSVSSGGQFTPITTGPVDDAAGNIISVALTSKGRILVLTEDQGASLLTLYTQASGLI